MNEKALVIRQVCVPWTPASLEDSAFNIFAQPSHFGFCPVVPTWDVGEERQLEQAADAFLLLQKVSDVKRNQRRRMLMKVFLCAEMLAVSILAVAAMTGTSVSSRPAAAVVQWCVNR
jgi:hypothetical protein